MIWHRHRSARGLVMSDSPLRELGTSIRESVAKHQALPPREKSLHRAGMGAMLVTGAIYVAWWCRAFTGWTAGRLLAVFFHAPASAPTSVWLPLALWVGAIILGLLWLVVGISSSRGSRDTMSIFWDGVCVAVSVALLLVAYFPHDWGDWVPIGNVVLRGFYLMFLASSALTLLLRLQPPARAPASTVPRTW